MTPDCGVFTIQAAMYGQEIQKITSEDKIPWFIVVCSELRRYHSHEHLACIAMTIPANLAFISVFEKD